MREESARDGPKLQPQLFISLVRYVPLNVRLCFIFEIERLGGKMTGRIGLAGGVGGEGGERGSRYRIEIRRPRFLLLSSLKLLYILSQL